MSPQRAARARRPSTASRAQRGSRKLANERSVVLLTPGDEKLRESGSGFVVANDEATSFVVTCAHVVETWPSVRVNGFTATEIRSGASEGVDIAVVRVPQLGVPALPLKSFLREGAPLYAVSYTHLYGIDYCRRTVDAVAGRNLALQRRHSGRLVPGCEITASQSSELVPGTSGSPVFDLATNKVAGILSHASRDGRTGVALSPVAISMVWEVPRSAGGADETIDPPPAVTAPVTDTDDPNKGRFGGRAEGNGRKLVADITQIAPDHFYFDLHVQSADRTKLEGPAVFHLHDSYPRAVIKVRAVDKNGDLSLRDVYSYGTYAVGCQIRDRNGEWVSLELDLVDVPAIPRRFHER